MRKFSRFLLFAILLVPLFFEVVDGLVLGLPDADEAAGAVVGLVIYRDPSVAVLPVRADVPRSILPALRALPEPHAATGRAGHGLCGLSIKIVGDATSYI